MLSFNKAKGTLNLHQIKHKLLSFVVRVVLKHNYRLVFLRQQKPLDQRSMFLPSCFGKRLLSSPSGKRPLVERSLKYKKNRAPLPPNGVNHLFIRRLFGGTLAKNYAPSVPPGCPSKKFNRRFCVYTKGILPIHKRYFAYTRKVFCVHAKGNNSVLNSVQLGPFSLLSCR